MSPLLTRLIAALAWLAALFAATARAETLPPSNEQHLAMTLVAETDRPAAGSTVTLALDTRPQPGWHGYWQNPGDAGFPAKFDWTLPAGAQVGAVQYPVPTTLLVAGLMNYVYERPYAPLVAVKIPSGLAIGTQLPIRVHADYLVCTTSLCVPERADLALDLVVGDGSVGADRRGQFDRWRRAIPKPLGSPATYQIANGAMRIAVPYPASAPTAGAYFFPMTQGLVDYAAPQSVTRDGDRLLIATKPGATPGTGALSGVLRIGDGQGLALSAQPGVIAAEPAGDGETHGWLAATLAALAGAVLGGLILNVMPCVFPILSLKALSLARGHLDERAARREALAYTAGVVLVCLALGAAILAFRAGGAAVGWAFQLQNPQVILVLLLLTVAIALNLSGLFEIPTPRFAGESGASGAFATGALAAFIATPCTGPFMGAALGAALVLPWPAALAVFAGLGVGLALPFLAIGFVPALRRRLPKPGGWMETFRHILSVPMWLTAIALGWVLGRQAGVDGMTLGLVAALVTSLLLWIYGGRQRRGLGGGWASLLGLIAVMAIGSALIERAPPAVAATIAGQVRPFSEGTLADLRKQGRPVFAYFTADWCLTCKVNEKAVIANAGVRKAFGEAKVAVLVGDWTDGDPALGRFIESHNRAGVPLYLYYRPGAAAPQVLPQVLTPGLLEGLARSPRA